jgi:hypothetical protein
MIRAGQLPSIQVGRKIVVPKAAVLRLLQIEDTDNVPALVGQEQGE